MSLYFKSEEDTMKNEIPAHIFLALALCSLATYKAFPSIPS